MTGFRGFDEAQLVRELERLPRQLRVGFACACAERLLPAYDAFVSRTGRGDPAVFARSLARLWADLVGEHPLEESEVQALIEACMSQIPKEDDQAWVTEQAAAEDAGAAVAYALRCRQNGRSREAAWAARRVYEALDHYVMSHEDVDVDTAGSESRVLRHPIIRAELARQRSDLAELLDAAGDDVKQVVAGLRARAMTDARTIFGAHS